MTTRYITKWQIQQFLHKVTRFPVVNITKEDSFYTFV